MARPSVDCFILRSFVNHVVPDLSALFLPMNKNPPTYEEISRRAYEIWQTQGSPAGNDTEHWLKAEEELAAPAGAHNAPSDSRGRGNGNSQSSGWAADPKVADLTSGHDHRHLLTPDEVAAKNLQQKKEARASHVAGENGHPMVPPQSGKPIWDKPHSR
jgi:hypothetical protein